MWQNIHLTRFFGLFCIIMSNPCVKNAKQNFKFSIVVAVSHNILHICKWTYRSSQPLQGGGKIQKTLEENICTLCFFNSYFDSSLSQSKPSTKGLPPKSLY
jgi:hypothetical protein